MWFWVAGQRGDYFKHSCGTPDGPMLIGHDHSGWQERHTAAAERLRPSDKGEARHWGWRGHAR